MFFLLGIAIYILGTFIVMYLIHCNALMLFNPASIMIHITAILAVLTSTQGFKPFYNGLKAAVFPNTPLSEDMRGQATALFRLLSKTAVLASLLRLFLGIISAVWLEDLMGDIRELLGLAYSNHPEILTSSVSLASPFVASIWGIILIGAVFEPVVFILNKRKNTYKCLRLKNHR